LCGADELDAIVAAAAVSKPVAATRSVSSSSAEFYAQKPSESARGPAPHAKPA